jgi:hypothetical protein
VRGESGGLVDDEDGVHEEIGENVPRG